MDMLDRQIANWLGLVIYKAGVGDAYELVDAAHLLYEIPIPPDAAVPTAIFTTLDYLWEEVARLLKDEEFLFNRANALLMRLPDYIIRDADGWCFWVSPIPRTPRPTLFKTHHRGPTVYAVLGQEVLSIGLPPISVIVMSEQSPATTDGHD